MRTSLIAASLLHKLHRKRDMNELLEKSSCVLVALLFMLGLRAGFSNMRREPWAALPADNCSICTVHDETWPTLHAAHHEARAVACSLEGARHMSLKYQRYCNRSKWPASPRLCILLQRQQGNHNSVCSRIETAP